MDAKEKLMQIGESGQPRWVEIQKKSHTVWCNSHLSNLRLKIENLSEDCKDGLLLTRLVEVISKQKLKPNKKPKMRIHRMINLNDLLSFLRDKEKLTLVNIGAEDIETGNLKITLGLVWKLVLHYDIATLDEGSPKWILLEWVKKQVKPYGLNPKNFTRDWSDGQLLSALTDSLEVGCVMDNEDQKISGLDDDVVTALTRTMKIAEEKFEIPEVISPIDLYEVPDEHSVMIMADYYRDYLDGKAEREAAERERLRQIMLKTPVAEHTVLLEVNDGFTSEDNFFKVQIRNAEGDVITSSLEENKDDIKIDLTVSAEGPSEVKIEEKGFEEGTYTYQYWVNKSGEYVITAKLDENEVKNSPANVVLKGAVAGTSTVSGNGIEGNVTQEQAQLTITSFTEAGEALGKGGDEFVVKVSGVDGEEVESAQVVDNEDGTYSSSYQPTKPGYYTVSVTLEGVELKDSPFNVLMEQANSGNSFLAGADESKTDREVVYTIQGVDKNAANIENGGDPFTVEVVDNDGNAVETQLVDNEDGTYSVKFTPVNAGDYTVTAKLFDQEIKDSPSKTSIKMAPVAQESYAEGPGLEGAFDNEATNFTVYAKDKNGNGVAGDDVAVTISSDEHKVEAKVKDNGDGTYGVEYHAEEAGTYTVDITIDGEQIKDMPKEVVVIEGAEADLSGFGECEFSFKFFARNKKGEPMTSGGSKFEVEIKGPDDVPSPEIKASDNGDGSYSASYTLPQADDGSQRKWKIYAKLNGKKIKGSPYVQKL